MITQRISLITIGANDLPSLRKFYQAFGWSEAEFSSDQYAVFQTAGVILTLYPMHELVKDAGLPEGTHVSTGFKGVTLAINLDKREDVDATIEAARQLGANIVREASDAFWGGRTAYFYDPEHNAWEIAWNPASVFDERGAMLSF